VEPYQLSITDAAAEIESRRLSPVELVQSALDRIEQVEGRLNAFVVVTAEQALEAARQAEKEISDGGYRGPLHGIPMGIKDLYDAVGVPTTSSSSVRSDYLPTEDSACVAMLRDAGAVMVGKTHTHEFAYGVTTPTTRNPWNTDRVPGGSSGGSGAAVAAGECLMGMGSDTGGSIRIPAAAVRHRRAQADLRADLAVRGDVAVLVARPCRPAHPDGARRGPGAPGPRRVRRP
jgi:aspartyl-tRNA(Asn)/glutamyl-tRNA(Gln) amidotransferase subunit A